MSGDDNSFDTPIELTIESLNNYSSVGFTITFEEFFDVYPVDVTITWYRGTTQLDQKNFTCNSSQFYFGNYVANFNKVVFTFNSMNKPSKLLKIYKLDFGIIRIYENKDLASTEVLQEMSSFSNELSINTFNFKLITEDDTQLYFQYKQPLKLYSNNNLIGTFFVTEGTRTSQNKYTVKSQDYIGLLDTVNFEGGIYNSYSTEQLIKDILDKSGVPYEIDVDTYPVSTLTGWIPYVTCREALQQVLFASGLVCDTSNSDKVKIFTMNIAIGNTYDESDVIQGKKTKTDKRITEVQLTEYFYKANSSNDVQTLYDASEQGTCTNKLIIFDRPYHTLSVTGGTIISSNANYAIITITSASGTLTGKEYDEKTSIYSIENTDVNINDPQNIISCDGCTLIGTNNAQYVCQKIFDYKLIQDTVTAEVIDLEENLGDKIEINSDYTGSHTGYIESIKFDPVHDGVKEIILH